MVLPRTILQLKIIHTTNFFYIHWPRIVVCIVGGRTINSLLQNSEQMKIRSFFKHSSICKNTVAGEMTEDVVYLYLSPEDHFDHNLFSIQCNDEQKRSLIFFHSPISLISTYNFFKKQHTLCSRHHPTQPILIFFMVNFSLIQQATLLTSNWNGRVFYRSTRKKRCYCYAQFF